jgi:hypothetical protein
MNLIGLRKAASELFAEAKAVVRVFPRPWQLARVKLSDPMNRAESFSCRAEEQIWYDLLALHLTTKKACGGSASHYVDLRDHMGQIEKFIAMI